jgi:hypothetical protein
MPSDVTRRLASIRLFLNQRVCVRRRQDFNSLVI